MRRRKSKVTQCEKCGEDAGVGYVIKRIVYCQKCGEVLLGLRDVTGKKIG